MTTKTKTSSDKFLRIRAKAFAGRGIETVKVMVSGDGTIRVYDSVAGHYTTCHSLTPHAIRRIRKTASKIIAL